jgi:hypothetical protein
MKFSAAAVGLLFVGLSLVGLSHGSIEWPVFFEHLGFVHSIHNKWDLVSMSINFLTPSMMLRQSKLECLSMLRFSD